MPHFAMLIKLTDADQSDVASLGQDVEALGSALEPLSGSLTAVLITLGAYDVVAIGTVGEEKDLGWLAGGLAASGRFSVETLVGFTPQDWAALQQTTSGRKNPFSKQ